MRHPNAPRAPPLRSAAPVDPSQILKAVCPPPCEHEFFIDSWDGGLECSPDSYTPSGRKSAPRGALLRQTGHDHESCAGANPSLEPASAMQIPPSVRSGGWRAAGPARSCTWPGVGPPPAASPYNRCGAAQVTETCPVGGLCAGLLVHTPTRCRRDRVDRQRRRRSSGQGSRLPTAARRHSRPTRLSHYHRQWTNEWGQVKLRITSARVRTSTHRAGPVAVVVGLPGRRREPVRGGETGLKTRIGGFGLSTLEN